MILPNFSSGSQRFDGGPHFHKPEGHQSIKLPVLWDADRVGWLGVGHKNYSLVPALQEQSILGGRDTINTQRKQLESNFVLSCEVQTFSSMAV